MYLKVFLLAVAAVAFTSAANNGGIQITVDGYTQTKYVISGDWAKDYVQLNQTAITLRGGGRVYLGDSNSGYISPESFYNMPLLGKKLSFDVDMSQVECGCNGALYFTTMPAYRADQQPQPGKNGEYYCDANDVGGTYCPEMDVMEANKYAMASTAHTCQYVPPHYYSSCDRGGCGRNVLDADYNGYGPGKRIDTNKPFSFSVSFITGGNGRLSTVRNVFSQGYERVQFDSCNPDYLQWMGMSLPGIVMSVSLWEANGGMGWLDGKSGCNENCNLANSQVTFSNIELTQL